MSSTAVGRKFTSGAPAGRLATQAAHSLRWSSRVVVLCGLVLVVGCSGGQPHDDEGEGVVSPGPYASQQETPIDDAHVFRMGDEVPVGKLEWHVNAAQDLGSALKSKGKPEMRATTGRFVLVTCSVHNKSKSRVGALRPPYLRAGSRQRLKDVPEASKYLVGLRALVCSCPQWA